MSSSPELHTQPDQATQQWLRERHATRLGHYRHWRRNLQSVDTPFELVHSAWRSTKLDSATPDERATVSFSELSDMDASLCTLTGMDVLETIYEHIHHEPERPASFGPDFVYRAMASIGRMYYDWQEMQRWTTIDYIYTRYYDPAQIRRTSYATVPPESKEVDRRMVMTTMTRLADPATQLCSPYDRRQLLGMPAVLDAIADGYAILQAVEGGTPYDQQQGYATETIHWHV